MRILLASAFVSLAPSAFAAGFVHVVAPQPGPGVDFTSVQAAVDAASDGDLILIRAGAYPASVVVVNDKSLQLVGDIEFGQVDAHFALQGNASGASTRWLVRNLALHGGGNGQAAVALAASTGGAWLEQCTLAAEPGALGNGALALANIAGTQVISCDVRPSSGTALTANASPLSLWNSSAHGGAGASSFAAGGPAAGAGISADGLVHASGCVLEGGAGAAANATCTIPAGDGGLGLALGGAASAWLSETTLFGGLAGSGNGACADGAVGEATNAPDAISFNPFGYPRSLETPSPVRESQRFVMSFNAIPDEFAFVALSFAPDFVALPELATVVGIGAPIDVFAIGTVLGGGAVPFTLTAGELGAGVESVTLYAQPVYFAPFFPPGFEWSVGAPASLALVDRSF